MEHAASPSLIALRLTADTSSEGSSFRWGLVSSCVLHALVLVMAMFIRFQSERDQPFRSIDVALISLPTLSTTTPQPVPSTKKTAIDTPPQKVAPPPTPPAAAVKEETLPPLPTETAVERLSESLGGAIHSIKVPQKQAPNTSTIPAQEPKLPTVEDQSPLLDKLRLPSAPPTIARAERLQPAEPFKTLPLPEPPSQTRVPPTTPAPMKSPTPPPPAEKIQPAVKPAPAIPALSEVTPFTKHEPSSEPPKASESSSIEQSLRRSSPNIQTPASKPTNPELSRKRPTSRPETKAFTPKISAPQLAPLPETPRPQPSVPAQPKMSDTVKKLMEGLKSTTGTSAPPLPRTKPATPTTPSITPPPSAIDQQIARLSIPDVTPQDSVQERLNQIQVQSLSDTNTSASQQSPGENRYFAIIEEAINKHWINPNVPISNKKVIMTFHVAKSGEISGIHVDQSSGNIYYDSAILSAIHKANPLPKFPSDLQKSFLNIKFLFTMPE